jgi:hypothetical protein
LSEQGTQVVFSMGHTSADHMATIAIWSALVTVNTIARHVSPYIGIVKNVGVCL